MDDLLWTPPEENYLSSNITSFFQYLEKNYDLQFKNNYDKAVMIHGDDQYHVKYVPKLFKKLEQKNRGKKNRMKKKTGKKN